MIPPPARLGVEFDHAHLLADVSPKAMCLLSLIHRSMPAGGQSSRRDGRATGLPPRRGYHHFRWPCMLGCATGG